MTDLTAYAILSCPIDPSVSEGKARTLREYFIETLMAVWTEDNFSAKHGAFGNSGWQYDIYLALSIRFGDLYPGCVTDEDGYLSELPDSTRLDMDVDILRAIREMA